LSWVTCLGCLKRLHIELGNSASEKELLKQELVELRSQLETERASQEKTEAELSEKEQNSAPATTLSEKLTPDATTILSQLRVRRKKSPVSLADIKAILEILEELTPVGGN
jgi:predicted  nucleic acid-binding Zn-ribbon protein